MTRLRMQLFGKPTITIDEQPIVTDRRKAIGLLSYLAVTQQPHTREALATLFWPESEPSRSFAYLRRTIWEINKMLGDGWLVVDRAQVGLQADREVWVDGVAFETAVSGHADIDALQVGIDLVNGSFMAGFSLRDSVAFDEWQVTQAAYYQQLLLASMKRLVRLLMDGGGWETAVSYAQRWLQYDKLDESAHRMLMQLYALMGERARAIRQYEVCERHLLAELDVSPDAATIALLAQIKDGTISQLLSAAQPVEPTEEVESDDEPSRSRILQFPNHNIPAETTPFVGRQRELTEIRTQLLADECRLLTLVGPGGTGKTRLALQLGKDVIHDFPHGVWFVPLAAVGSIEQIVTAVAKSLQFVFYDEGGLPKKQLVDFLRGKHLLLVLDNYEHLLEAGGGMFVHEVLSVASHVTVLATSRMRLQLQGEQLYTVEGMSLPDVETAVSWLPENMAIEARKYSGMQLFLQSSRRVQPDFEINVHNLIDVLTICQLVQGMPLAIELAAGWMEMLSPAEIRAEIAESVDFLETEAQDVPERQRSIRAVFNYSWSLMSEAEQQLFPKLAIFHGDFTRAAAQQVTQASLRTLMRLANKSLVWRKENGRFAIHELLRQYAIEKLQEDAELWAAVREWHSTFYLTFLQKQSLIMRGAQQKAAYDAVEDDLDNIRAAWLWAVVAEDYDSVLAGLEGLFNYFIVRSTMQALADLLDLVMADVETAAAAVPINLQIPQPIHILHASLVALAAFVNSYDYASQVPVELGRRAIELIKLYNVQQQMSFYFGMVSMIYIGRIDREKGIEFAREAEQSVRKMGDPWVLATTLSFVGGAFGSLGLRVEAKQRLQEGMTLSRQVGDRMLLAYNLSAYAELIGDEHDYEASIRILEECVEIYESVGNLASGGNALMQLASTYDGMGDYEMALKHYQQARSMYKRLGDRLSIAASLSWESISARRIGKMEKSLQMRQLALAAFTEIQDKNGTAWCHFELNEIYRYLGDLDVARSHLAQSRVIFEEVKMIRGLSFSTRARGEYLMLDGDFEAARAAFEEALV
ncbi:MAG: tetratricopeptide repeat protein, partial [Chloroflexi bacterium]|nr:tetratricopeptide repeat protein [Chloroflexota bacterium]